MPAAGATEQGLASLMVGRDVLLRVEKPPGDPAEPLLEVDDLHVVDDRGVEKVRGISFQVRAGEIVGIAGVDGNGQTELIDAMTGLMKVDGRHGSRVAGADVTSATRARSTSRRDSGTSPRIVSAAASSSTSRSPRTSRCTTTGCRPTRGAAGSSRGR